MIEKIISQNSRFSGLPEKLEQLNCQNAATGAVFSRIGRCLSTESHKYRNIFPGVAATSQDRGEGLRMWEAVSDG